MIVNYVNKKLSTDFSTGEYKGKAAFCVFFSHVIEKNIIDVNKFFTKV